MNATTVNERLLAGDKVMPEMYLNSQDLHIVLVDHSLKRKKEKKMEIQYIFVKTNWIKLVFLI